jgi:hypothetical protein
MNEDKDIRDALNTLSPDPEPSPELMRKLRFAARVTKEKKSPWIGRLSLMAVGFAAVATGVLILLPSNGEAKTLDKFVRAVDQTNAFQFRIESKEAGDAGSLSIAGQDGTVTMRTDEGGVMEFRTGELSIYDADDKTITRMKFGKYLPMEQIAKEVKAGVAEGLKQMDIKKILRDYQKENGTEKVQISPVHFEGTRRVYDVVLGQTNEQERLTFRVDAGTDLPYRMQVAARDAGGGYRDTVLMEMRFGNDVDPKALHADFPANAKVQEIDLGGMVDGVIKGAENLGKMFGDSPAKP